MKNVLKNSDGALTLDFLFALVIVMGMTCAFGIFTFALSIVETAQYAAFASSRAYFAGNISQKQQKAYAEAKFNQLLSKDKLRLFLRPSWVGLKPNWADFGPMYNVQDTRDVFEGTRVEVNLKILAFSIPLLGTASKDAAYTTVITSFLGREVSDDECLQFNSERFKNIQKLSPSFSNNVIIEKDYATISDNGC